MMPVRFMNEDHEEHRREQRQESLAVLLAEQVVGDVDADEVEAHLDEALAAAGNDASCGGCRARRSRRGPRPTMKRIRMMRLISKGVPSKKMHRREEFVDRRTVEDHLVGGRERNQQVESVS